MVQLSRSRLGQKIAKIGNRLLSERSGFMPEHTLTLRMLESVEDFQEDIEEEGIQSINWGGGLTKDYDPTKYWSGEYIKEYEYNFLIPYQQPKTKEQRPFICTLHFKRMWYQEESLGKPELLGYAYCDTSRGSEKKVLEDLKASGWDLVKIDDEWKVTGQ